MVTAIGDILPLAVGVALSPISIIAVILMMVGGRGRLNGPLFVLSWFGGIILLNALVILLAQGHDYSARSGPSLIISMVRVAIGLLLLFVAFRSWRGRPKHGEHAEMPKWIQAVDRFTPMKAFGLGAGLAVFNAKNLPTTVSAATILAQEGLAVMQTIIVVAVFAVIATLGVAAPIAVVWLGGDRAQSILNDWKQWLSDNNAAIMFVLFLYLGLHTLGKGLGGLF